MKMKSKFLPVLICAASICAIVSSCEKQQTILSGADVMLSVTVDDLDGMLPTKAADQTEAKESSIKNIQLFVFNKSTGQVDNAVCKDGLDAKGEYTLEPLQCTVGEKEIWVVVNGPENYVESVGNLSDLKGKTVSLSDNGLASLIMSGSATRTLAAGNDALTIQVSRLCAAVVLTKVENMMLVPAYRDKLTITGAYLMNVPAVQKVDGSISSDSAGASWNAFYGKASLAEPSELLTETITPTSIPYQQSHSATHSFYSFANVYDKVEGTDARGNSSTYLVVECTVDGVACVYPVLLPSLEANNKYNVSLTINHIGGDPDYPWRKVQFSSFTPTVKVQPWNTSEVSETI